MSLEDHHPSIPESSPSTFAGQIPQIPPSTPLKKGSAAVARLEHMGSTLRLVLSVMGPWGDCVGIIGIFHDVSWANRIISSLNNCLVVVYPPL